MLKTSNNFQISTFFFEKWKEQLKRFEGENLALNEKKLFPLAFSF